MKKVFVLLVVMIGSIMMLNEVNASEFKKFEGTWAYKVPTAPYEYSTGELIIDKLEGKETVTVKFSDGTKVKAEKISCEKSVIKFSVYVNYEYVDVSCKLEQGKLKGKVNTPEGPMEITAQKK